MAWYGTVSATDSRAAALRVMMVRTTDVSFIIRFMSTTPVVVEIEFWSSSARVESKREKPGEQRSDVNKGTSSCRAATEDRGQDRASGNLSVPFSERKRPFSLPRIANGVGGSQHKWLGRCIHDPTATDPLEFSSAFRVVGDKLGDKMCNVPAGTQVRNWDQRERAWLLRTEFRSAVITGQAVAIFAGKHKRHRTSKFTGDRPVTLRRVRRVRLDLALAVVKAQISGKANSPVRSSGFAR